MRMVSAYIQPGGSKRPSRVNSPVHVGFRGFWLTSAIRQLFDLQVRAMYSTPLHIIRLGALVDQS